MCYGIFLSEILTISFSPVTEFLLQPASFLNSPPVSFSLHLSQIHFLFPFSFADFTRTLLSLLPINYELFKVIWFVFLFFFFLLPKISSSCPCDKCVHLRALNRDIPEIQKIYMLFRYCIDFQYSQSIFHLQV